MPDLVETSFAPAGSRALELNPNLVAPPSFPTLPDAVLRFERVSKWFGPVLGLNQVSLELRPGITGLVGHNGAGKSTLLHLAAGLLRPELGRVTVRGIDTWTAAAKRRIGFVPELDAFFDQHSGRRFLEVLARLGGFDRTSARKRVGELLDLVGMSDRADRQLAGYSKGMRQRIKLAQALIADPPLLLLDEPFNGIDPLGRRELVDVFRKLAMQGKCLLVSSHELDALDRLTDEVAILTGGRLAAAGPIGKIRELLDDHPHGYRIDCDRPDILARHLVAWDMVLGLDRDASGLMLRVRQPRGFCERLATLIREERLEITRLETLDDSTEDVLGYLLR
jgi:ABC-2 type transport system ATP-binding protein